MIFENMIIDNIYQVISEIGSGGMGVVYLCYHLRLEKYVVLKKIKNSCADISLLRNEVDILKSLHHSYLPQVYDFIEYNGDLYTVIDYIDGYDFSYYINNGYVFSEGQLIKWLRQLCEVLDYLHSHSPMILHTDIKPGNIIVTVSGDICLIDFGISLYDTNVIKGLSENYSSPEQYANFCYLQYGTGEYTQLDAQTDIYSLGATFYHIMTGVRPEISALYEQPTIHRYELNYSQTFVDIIGRAMEPDREQRFKSAKAMLKAIDNMKKQDSRYKKYVLTQIASSVLAAALIVSGIIMIIKGYNNQVLSEYEQDYNSFLSLSELGDTEGAADAGESILNDVRYGKYIESFQRALILHKIGDGYFDENDYYNAAYYYREALNYETTELFYRDYAFALIFDSRADEAKAVIEEITALYPQSAVISLVKAQLCYNQGDYQGAVSIVDSISASLESDSENSYAAFVIKGDSCNAMFDLSGAISAYKSAAESKETAVILRKLGNTLIKYADKNLSASEYRDAAQCFKRIYDSYEANIDDVINLAQCCILAEDFSSYNDCMKMLSEISEKYDDCRIYIMLAIFSDATGDTKTEQYCRKSNALYKELSDEDKMRISDDSLKEIKRLYKSYCGQDW